jgi:hypothetical protein
MNGSPQSARKCRRPDQSPHPGNREIRYFDAVQIDWLCQRHVEISLAIQACGVNLNLMATLH